MNSTIRVPGIIENEPIYGPYNNMPASYSNFVRLILRPGIKAYITFFVEAANENVLQIYEIVSETEVKVTKDDEGNEIIKGNFARNINRCTLSNTSDVSKTYYVLASHKNKLDDSIEGWYPSAFDYKFYTVDGNFINAETNDTIEVLTNGIAIFRFEDSEAEKDQDYFDIGCVIRFTEI